MKRKVLLCSLALAMALLPSCKKDDNKSQTGTTEEKKDTRAVYPVNEKVNPFTWIAIDGQGNTIDPDNSGYKDANQNKKKQVAIFYFLWHGCHGYDKGANHNDVVPPKASDTKSPYDIEKLLADNPNSPEYGPF